MARQLWDLGHTLHSQPECLCLQGEKQLDPDPAETVPALRLSSATYHLREGCGGVACAPVRGYSSLLGPGATEFDLSLTLHPWHQQTQQNVTTFCTPLTHTHTHGLKPPVSLGQCSRLLAALHALPLR